MNSERGEDGLADGQSGTFDGVLEDVGHTMEPKRSAGGEREKV